MIGCGGEVASGPTVEAWDSAGVTIVENKGELEPGAGGWSVSSSPFLEIGSLDGEEESQLYRVRGARRLSDGRVAVGKDGTLEVRFLGPGG